MKLRKRIAVVAVAIAALGGLALTGCTPTTDTTTHGDPCHVDSKDRSTDSKGRSVYRVYTSCGVFNVEDAMFLGKFNSADLYASIKPGRDYLFETYGYRNGFLSIFPNITEAHEVTK